jgi:hypothetical protein
LVVTTHLAVAQDRPESLPRTIPALGLASREVHIRLADHVERCVDEESATVDDSWVRVVDPSFAGSRQRLHRSARVVERHATIRRLEVFDAATEGVVIRLQEHMQDAVLSHNPRRGDAAPLYGRHVDRV